MSSSVNFARPLPSPRELLNPPFWILYPFYRELNC
nr:MAG TPA: hypothetical protein [Caudoviricetes sp.]